MIVYRKSAPLRVRRATAPEPPFWCATTVAPYGARRAAPVSIDYLDLHATAAERLEVAVCDDPRDELERMARIAPPVLVESAEFAEEIFRRGEDVIAFCAARALPNVQLISSHGAPPERAHPDTIAIASWPLDLERLERLFARTGSSSPQWGVVVPVLFPVTTDLVALRELADLARSAGASFLSAVPIVMDATAKQAIARSLALDGEDETYAMLFHSQLDPIHVATERHIAALAAERGMEDFVVPPNRSERTNWNAAIVLMLAATRLLAMEEDVDLAALLARSARVVAELDKPLLRIAEAASLSIVEALDDASVDILTEWLETGRSRYADRVNARWRLRRDFPASGAAPSPSS